MAGLGVSLGLAVFFGLITGFIISRKWFLPVDSAKECGGLFNDKEHWIGAVIEHECLEKASTKIDEKRYDSVGAAEDD